MSAQEHPIYTQALLAWHRNLTQDTATLLETLLKENPNHLNGHCLMAQCKEALYDDGAAEAHFNQALRLSPINHPVWEYYADFMSARGDFVKAERALLRSLINNPLTAPIYVKLARNFCYLNQLRAADETLYILSSAAKDDPMLAALSNYADYLNSNHKGFVVNHNGCEVFMRIGRYDIDAESKMLRSLFNNTYLCQMLQKYISAVDVCVEIGAGAGLHTVIMSSICGAACVIPIDPRPNAEDALTYAEQKNAGLIELKYLKHAIGNGQTCVKLYPNAPLGTQLRPDPSGDLQTTALDDLGLPRVNVLINHNHHLHAEVLEGAKETLTKYRPRCILRMPANAVEQTHTRMAEQGYRFVGGDYAQDDVSLYCIYKAV